MEVKRFGIKNFRVFKEYQEFRLAPLTILTGPNNSGKSTFTKAMLFVQENNVYFKNVNSLDQEFCNFKYSSKSFDLGNQTLVTNDENLNSEFYFNTFQDYKFCTDGQKLIRIRDANNIIIFSINTFWLYDETLSDEIEKYRTDNNQYVKLYINVKLFINYINRILNFYNTYNVIGPISRYKTLADKILNEVKLSEQELRTILYIKDTISKLKTTNGIFETESIYLDDLYKYGPKNMETIFINIIDVLSEKNIINGNIPLDYIANGDIKRGIRKLLPVFDSDTFSFKNIKYIPRLNKPLKRLYKHSLHNSYEDDLIMEILDKYGEDHDYGGLIWTINEQLWTIFNIKDYLKITHHRQLGDVFSITLGEKSFQDLGLGFSQVILTLLVLNSDLGSAVQIKIESASLSTDEATRELPTTIKSKNNTVILEEPETGLHPAFQSKLAELFVNIMNDKSINFIIETHSEYFIRKLQYLVAKKEISNQNIALYYFNDPNNIPEGEKQVKEMIIREDGILENDFGTGFFDEATKLSIDLLKVQNLN